MNHCLHQLFESQYDLRPNAVAVEYGGTKLTYRELNRRANRLAHQLNGMGVQPDSLVGLFLERSLEMVVALLGILKSGAAYLPMDAAYPPERLAFILEHAKPKVLITQNGLVESLPAHHASVICVDSQLSNSPDGSEILKSQTTPDNLAYVIYTSGSTGRPKGVAMTHQALVDLIVWQCQASTLGESGRTLQFAPLSFDVSFQEIFATWCSGGTLVLIDNQARRDPTALLEFLQTQKIERLFLPFVALQQLAEAVAEAKIIPVALREVYTAGEQLLITPKILKLFEKIPGCSLHNHYGPTESHVVTAFTLPTKRHRWDSRPSIGHSVANSKVLILDENLNKVSSDRSGEIFIGGSSLARGYLDRPELTAERFVPNPFETSARLYKTGDMARWLPDGNIEFLGRVDHQVKIRGFRIELGEIETVLNQYRGVKQAAVLVREGLAGDKRLVAYVVHDSDQELSIPELRKFLKLQLPHYMVPSYFVTLAELPVTPSGKVDRLALPVPEMAPINRNNGFVQPRDKVELQLTKIWESILGFGPIAINENFFDLGGDSLLAPKLRTQIQKVLGKTVPLSVLFQEPTVERLANFLRHGNHAHWSCLLPVQTEGNHPPFFCVHGYAGYSQLAKYLGNQQPLYGLLQGLDGKKFYTHVEEIAVVYLRELRVIQPEGPYFLGGHSFGGLVAFEMAHQLQSWGEKVSLVALIDPDDPSATPPRRTPGQSKAKTPFSLLGDKISRQWKVYRDLRNRERVEQTLKLIRQTLNRITSATLRVVCETYLALGRPLPPRLRTFYINKILFGSLYELSAKAYRPTEYRGDVVFFRAENSAGSSEYFWRSIVSGRLAVFNVPGNHLTILQEPYVRILANHLKDCLAKARFHCVCLAWITSM